MSRPWEVFDGCWEGTSRRCLWVSLTLINLVRDVEPLMVVSVRLSRIPGAMSYMIPICAAIGASMRPVEYGGTDQLP